MTNTVFTQRELRDTLSTFATGVTVVTCLDADGEPIGATASSFNSVSMDPPLILWSITKASYCASAFLSASEFVVNVLSSDQIDLSNRFAMSGGDKFAGVNVSHGIGNVPMLDDCVSRLQCKTWNIYDGGDHAIIIGEVMAMKTTDREGLVFYRGKYATPTLVV